MKLRVNAQNGAYDIRIGSGLIADEALIGYDRYAVITDDVVYPLYGGRFEREQCYILPAGEASKNMREYEGILEFLLKRNLGRTDAVVALGGGVVGDIAGFAAATFKRGVGFVQVPTTLLAQVDSSVGGKVAVNLPGGKNMAGAFYQPSSVIADTDTLKTLDKRQYAAGMAEVIKYAYIASAPLHTMLAEQKFEIEQVIYDCCAIKAKYVEQDPFDKGVRMQLNYGHTFGHAIEAAAGYGAYLHGEAVAMGMALAAYVGERLSVSPGGLARDTAALLKAYGLPHEVDGKLKDKLAGYLGTDKKAEHGAVDFILIDRIGHAAIQKIALTELAKLLKEYKI